MKVKELQKTVNVAWSPEELYPIYLATGSAAQQLDSNGDSVLEIYSTNLNEPGYDLELKASLPSQYRFQKLIWSPNGHNGNYQNGLLVGGCEKGNLMVYSASKMLDGEEGIIARQDSHTGAVRGLDFNPYQTNLLASVASESEIFVWDLNNIATHMTPGTKTQPLEDVQNISWNRQVQHILASVFSSRCVIWDLRKNEQIIKMSDTQSRVRWRAVQWHPDVATQIWLASEEDQAPIVQMWDLRYATAPAKSMQIHQRGVLSMSWCSKDPDMMVSCGKDNRIYCWNPNTNLPEGEILCEVAVTPQWYSDVQWCPKNPALIASSSLDGNVSIFSLFGGTQQHVQTSNKIADSFPGIDQFDQAAIPPHNNQVTNSDPSKPPKWMKKQCGVKFGFGGKLLTFNPKSRSVHIKRIVTDPHVVEREVNLQKLLTNGNFSEFCRNKADEVNNQGYRYIWYFLKANFETNPKEEMLDLLGYNTEDLCLKFSKYLRNEDEVNDNMELNTRRIGTLNYQTVNQDHYLDAERPEESIDNKCRNSTVSNKNDLDGLISEAIISGNIEAAVELCFEAGRPAEALAIASTAGTEFLQKTQDRFLNKQDCELSNVISALVTRNWLNFVSQCAIDSWKKALVAALNHSDRKVVNICEKLGDRLLAENSQVENIKSAVLCYICAGSIEKIVKAWYKLKSLEKNITAYELDNSELQELAEMVMILSKSLEQQGILVEPDGEFAEFVFRYGTHLVAQGAISVATAYVFALSPSTLPELIDLRDRLSNIINKKSNTRTSDKPDVSNPDKFYNKQTNYCPQPHEQFLSNCRPVAPVQAIFNAGMPVANQLNITSPNAQSQIQASRPINIYNPQQQNSPNISQMLPQTVASQRTKDATAAQVYESLAYPPRPSSVNSQGSSALTSRSKYILDPSVCNGPQYGSTHYGGSYNQAPALSPNNFNTTPVTTSSTWQSTPTQVPTVSPMESNYMPLNSMQLPQQNYVPGIGSTASSVQTQSHVQKNPTPPPGWNDPPVLKSNNQQIKKTEPAGSPITHPIFGIDPNKNSYFDPTAMKHHENPTTPQQSNVGQQSLPQLPFNVNQRNNMQATFHPSMHLQDHTGCQEQPAPVQRHLPEIHVKPNLPEEFIYMQTVFEELKSKCLLAALDPRTKRKFVDVTKRLENLFDCLKDRRLTPNTIEALNQIVQFIQVGDYVNALATHTTIAFGTDFAQTASFMPGIKFLIQSAIDLKVFLC